MDSSTSPVLYPEINTGNFFRRKNNTTVAFAVGVFLFLLPFVQLSCGAVTVAENTGLGLATGAEWKVSSVGGTNSILNELNAIGNRKKEKMKTDPDWFLLLAIVFAVTGIIFSVSNWKIKQVGAMSAGILAAVMLIAAFIHLRFLIRSQIPLASKYDSPGMGLGQLLKIKFTIWYLISLLAFISASFFGYKHHIVEMKDAMEREFKFDFQSEKEE